MNEANELHLDKAANSASFIGQELRGGRYLIEEKIAQGGSAWLFRAVHRSLQEPMALKLLYPQFLDNPIIRNRFLEEARIQFRLKHQHIVHITDVIDEKHCLGIVMEWVEGEDLRTLLRRLSRPLQTDEIEALLFPILRALHFVHRTGLVHRDIKPANILVAHDGNQYIPKLTDFGIAKMLAEEGQTVTGSTLGTVTYMAPEQINDAKHVTPQADIYSVGVMLFQLLTGQVPFSGNPQQQLIKHLKDRPPTPSSIRPEISPELDRLVLWCMEKEPMDRPKDCGVLLTELFSVLGGRIRMPTAEQIDAKEEPRAKKDSALNSELEFLLDHIMDSPEDEPPTFISPEQGASIRESARLGRVDIERRPASQVQGGHLLKKDVASRTEGAKESSSTFSLRPQAKPNTPISMTPKGYNEQHVSPSENQDLKQMIWIALGVVVLGVVIGGSSWFFLSQKKERNPVSPPASRRSRATQQSMQRVCFKVRPSKKYFFFKFGSKSAIKRGSFCRNILTGTVISLKREQYYPCSFELPVGVQTLKLNILQKKSTRQIPTSSYCYTP